MTDKCLECGARAAWIRMTQFAGDHPYCDKHARLEPDFNQDDSYAFWTRIVDPEIENILAGEEVVEDFGGYEEGTMEKYQEFVKNRNYHFEDTKMTLKHMKGNLIDLAEAGKFDVIIHGCNCFNTMGGGIAREIRERYPMAAKADQSTIAGNIDKLGSFTAYETGDFLIVNAYTQYEMSKGEDVFEYDAFGVLIRKFAHIFKGQRIGIPYIGMGLAGGDKDLIMGYIEHFASIADVTLVEFG